MHALLATSLLTVLVGHCQFIVLATHFELLASNHNSTRLGFSRWQGTKKNTHWIRIWVKSNWIQSFHDCCFLMLFFMCMLQLSHKHKNKAVSKAPPASKHPRSDGGRLTTHYDGWNLEQPVSSWLLVLELEHPVSQCVLYNGCWNNTWSLNVWACRVLWLVEHPQARSSFYVNAVWLKHHPVSWCTY